jgi:hypothetical protein
LLISVLGLAWAGGIPIVSAFCRWDALHYLAIADGGYTDLTQTAFFPGLPGLMTLLALIGVPGWITGVATAWIGSAFTAWGLYRLAGDPIRGALAVWAWSFAPMAIFTVVPYTEAIFGAFAVWAFWFAKQKRWGLAATLTGFACLFRVSGLFLIAALVVVALVEKSSWGVRVRRLLWLAIPMGVLAVYLGFMRLAFGSWTVWFDAQYQGWGRRFRWPWLAVIETLRLGGVSVPASHGNVAVFRWELAAFTIGLALTIWWLVRKRWVAASWVGLQVLALSCQVWLVSIARSMLLWFPLFLVFGDLGSGAVDRRRNRLRRIMIGLALACEIVAMEWWAWRYVRGAWAG